MNTITLDPVTKRFTQIEPDEKICYICGSNNFVDDHHIDCRKGEISPKTVPLCRRCHSTIHMFNGIHMFEDDLLNKAIEVWNMTEVLYGRPLMTKDKIKRSNYWLKKHRVEEIVTFNPATKRFVQGRLL